MLVEKLKRRDGFGTLMSTGFMAVIISAIISSASIWYMNLHKNIEHVATNPLAQSVAQDRINDVLNKSFYENYKKAQSGTVSKSLHDGDGNIIYPGDKFDIDTEYSDAKTCDGQLCYRVKVDVKDKDSGEIVYTSNETILESQSGRGTPIGTVLAFNGNLSEIPYGWEPYNKMDGYYSKGAHDENDITETGGQKTFVIKPENMPPYKFTFQFDRFMANGGTWEKREGGGIYRIGAQSGVVDLNYHYGATGWPLFIDFGQMNLTINVDEWQNKPFVMEPSYYKVGYIIKTKQVD